jgi:hypothetical protein
MIRALTKLAPIVLKVAKVIVVITPHVLAAYQYRKERKFYPNRKRLK